MDQCSYWHDIPSALQATSPNRPGHDLAVGINDHPSQTQYSPASGSMISLARIRTQTRQRHADRHPLVRARAHVALAHGGYSAVDGKQGVAERQSTAGEHTDVHHDPGGPDGAGA